MKDNWELESKKEKLECSIAEQERALKFQANEKDKEQITNYIEAIQRKINFINFELQETNNIRF